MMDKKNIAVIYGGTSSERDISLNTGKNVGSALTNIGHNVSYFDPKNKNDLIKLIDNNFDIAYIGLHGRGGEDGRIQGFLETIGLTYTGSKVQASAVAMDKATTKEVYDEFEIKNAEYFVVVKGKDYKLENLLKTTGEDVVVKAANEGSSIGLYFAKGKEDIAYKIQQAFEYDDKVVVEKNIIGYDFTVAVLDFPSEIINSYNDILNFSGNLAALPVIEIVPKNEFYDFASKYDKGGSEHICPAKIEDSLKDELQYMAISAHRALACSGFSRTDFKVTKNGKAYALETNTLPGMTKTSLVPDAARAVGIEFEELCNIIIEYALSL